MRFQKDSNNISIIIKVSHSEQPIRASVWVKIQCISQPHQNRHNSLQTARQGSQTKQTFTPHVFNATISRGKSIDICWFFCWLPQNWITACDLRRWRQDSRGGVAGPCFCPQRHSWMISGGRGCGDWPWEGWWRPAAVAAACWGFWLRTQPLSSKRQAKTASQERKVWRRKDRMTKQ